jgi:ribosomal protein L37E
MGTEVAQGAQRDFWRAPIQTAVPEAAGHSDLVEACDRCGTEFIVGSRFCHSCGASRSEPTQAFRIKETVSALQLHRLGERLGLPTAAFIAFLLGIVCVIGAASVGFVFTAQSVLDWQAVQLWRIEWLLGAVAAFVAGTLLKASR